MRIAQSSPSLCDSSNFFRFHDHGDTIAIQYGGSHLVNTMETYRKINQWSSHSRDMVESFKRYYNNSFLDGQRQEAYNLFLGNYIFAQGQPMLWDLSTDYYLHHADPKNWSGKVRRNYKEWFDPSHLVKRRLPQTIQPSQTDPLEALSFYEDYWLEYYRPLALSSFLKIFSFRMNSTLRYIPFKSTQDGQFDLSPFRPRTSHENNSPEKSGTRKGVTIIDPSIQDDSVGTNKSVRLAAPVGQSPANHEELKEVHSNHVEVEIPQENRLQLGFGLKTAQELPKTAATFHDKAAVTQWTMNHIVGSSLNPSVEAKEMDEYGRYMSHPLNLPLVVSGETSPAQHLDFLSYLEGPSRFSDAGIFPSEEDVAEFSDYFDVEEEPLTVTEADLPKKRYKAYGQWLRGKSLFKQSRIES